MKPNQISKTAAFIAVKFYGLTREGVYQSLFDSDIIQFYERTVRSLPVPISYYYKGLKQSWLRRFFTFWEELLLPGDLMHILLRKWYLTTWVETLRRQGYRQMLVLGAGFDHLATLSAPKGMQCLELDTPKMSEIKQDFIIKNEYKHPYLVLRKAFFTHHSLKKILDDDTTLKPGKKTIVITEGFFDYLSRNACSQILDDLKKHFTGDVTLLSTLFSLHELSGFRSFVYQNSIKLAGEKLRLGLDKDGFTSFLQNHHFKIAEIKEPDEMQRKVLIPENISYPVLKGFYLIRAELE